MKIKAKKWLEVLTMITLCGMVAPVVGTAHAREAWYTCTVDQVTDGVGGGLVKLTRVDGHSRFALKWFRLSKDQKANIISTATAAMHSGQTVYANMDVDGGSFPQIQSMDLKPRGGKRWY